MKVAPLFFDSYLAVVKNSVGSKMFRNFYVKVGGKKEDIMRNGELSCAFYVSAILTLFKFIKETHGTVASTVLDLKNSGWKQVKKPKVGSVIVWSKIDFGNSDIHTHIGFYVGKNSAMSNNYKLGHPTEHHWTFNGTRKIDSIWWKTKL